MSGFTKPRLVIQSGTRAAQPSGALTPTEGALYYVTDENIVERFDGSSWDQFGPGGYTLPTDVTFNSVNVSGTGGPVLTVSGYSQFGPGMRVGRVSYNDTWCTDSSQGLRLMAFDVVSGSFNDGASLQFFGNGTAFPGNAYFGTGSGTSAAVIFRTNGATATERMRIDPSGVKIPSNTPLYASGNCYIQNGSGYISLIADGGSGRPNINFIRQTSGNLEIGFFDFYANNDSGTQTLFTRFKGEVLSHTSGSEVGYMGFLIKDTDQTFPINRFGVRGGGLLVAGSTGTLPSPPATGKGGAIFYDIGTAFASMGTNSAAIYADDVAGTTEMFVIDEAGTASQISPHNFTLFTPAPPDGKVVNEAPFSYVSRNDYLGVEIGIDWARLIAALEDLTGQTFAHMRTFPARSYQADARRNFEVDKARYEAWESLPAPERAQTPEPPPPVIKRLPQWVQDRFDAGRKAAMDAELAVLDSELDAWEGAKPGRRAAVAARRGR